MTKDKDSSSSEEHATWYRRKLRGDQCEHDISRDCQTLEIQFTLENRTRRRFRFEPRLHGSDWWRFEDEWTGCTWRPIGREPIRNIDVLAADREAPNE